MAERSGRLDSGLSQGQTLDDSFALRLGRRSSMNSRKLIIKRTARMIKSGSVNAMVDTAKTGPIDTRATPRRTILLERT